MIGGITFLITAFGTGGYLVKGNRSMLLLNSVEGMFFMRDGIAVWVD